MLTKKYLISLFTIVCRAFSLTWPTSMLICWKKREHSHEKGVQLPEDFLGTPIWRPWRHVKTLYKPMPIFFLLLNLKMTVERSKRGPFLTLIFNFSLRRFYTGLSASKYASSRRHGFSLSLQVFGGVLVNLNSLLDWLSWIKYISIFRYAIEVINERVC